MNFKNYYHESPSAQTGRILKSYNNSDHKIAVWNAFVDSELPGLTDDDFSIIPRMLPASYLPILEKTAKDITEFALRLMTLPEAEVKAIVPEGPIRDFLINELEVLKYRPKRLTGSFRFDMAITGEPTPNNPPKLLEINEIGFDGLARSTYFQKTLLDLMPDLKKRVIALDTAAAEIRNMRRLGNDIARVQYDCYNWDELYLQYTAEKMGSKLHFVSPGQYQCKKDKAFPLMNYDHFTFPKGHVQIGKKFKPDSLNMSFAFTLADYKKHKDLYQKIVTSKTPQYGPFLSGLVATKTILIMLNDQGLRKKILGSSERLKDAILPAFTLEGNHEEVQHHPHKYVLKHTDGFGGYQVFMNDEMLKNLKKITPKKRHEWVIQQKTFLNTLDVNGILSRKKNVIGDLGVFVHYDWEDGKFKHFEVGGLMCRATNKGLKVNVSSGGLQVAVMLDRSC